MTGRELFTHPTTPTADGWGSLDSGLEDDLELELDKATIALVYELETELRRTIGSVPAAWFRSNSGRIS